MFYEPTDTEPVSHPAEDEAWLDAWRKAEEAEDEERRRNAALENYICGQIFEWDQAVKMQKQITWMKVFWPRGGFKGLRNRPPRKGDFNREGSTIFPESSLWVQIYDLMLGCKNQRNHCAHQLGTYEDLLAFSQIRQHYVDLLPLLELLSDKIKAALEDTDAWQKDPHATSKVPERPDYAKEFPEAEAILLAREEELDCARTEFAIFEPTAKEAWANKAPGTEIYDSDIAYIRFNWSASQGVEFEDCPEEYEYLEDEVAQFGSSTESDEGAEPETVAQDRTPVETADGIWDW